MRRQDGSISISVLQTEEQKYAYRGNDIPTSDFIIALSEPGKYCIEIKAKNFRGNYGISGCPETQKGERHDKTCYQNKKMQRQNPIIQYSLFYWNIGGDILQIDGLFLI